MPMRSLLSRKKPAAKWHLGHGAKAQIRTFLSNTSGVAAVEFALLAPLLMLMTFGTFEISRALIAHKRFQRATAMIGDLVAREKQIGATATDASDTLDGMLVSAEHVMKPFSSSPLQMAITQLRASSTNADQTKVEWAWSYHAMEISDCGDAKSMPDKNMVSKGDAALVIEAKYTYQPLLAQIIPGLSATMTWSDTMTYSPRWGAVFYGQDTLNTKCPPGSG
jgi:Flp pilus assembly protein TadG